MNPYILTFFLMGLGLGTTLTFMSSHWLLAWMGLELSTLAILPLMAHDHQPRAVEATIKYFLTQATAAAMLLFGAMTNAWLSGHWDLHQVSHPLPTTIVLLALALKIGLAPLHTWLPEVLQGLTLTTGLILSTWQKLAPFALLLQIAPADSPLLLTLGLVSVLVGGWGGLNQTQLRKILAYSSVAHLGWMALILQFSPPLTLLAFLTYLIMTSSTFLAFKVNGVTTVNTLATSWAKIPALSALVPLVLLSLGGLPPLTGFLPKWLIIQELASQNMALIATVAALSALLSLFFYLRLSYAMTLTISPNTLASFSSWRLNPTQFTLPLATLALLATSLLPLVPAIKAFLLP
uniref:NADH-ubiquinone oxidoreductase chain 2 n=1 Tax=Atherina boyeri TaxID=87785 RepID=A0A8E8PAW6_ATHBO|nr:NADH dehydrogenase subunit 2 [Atherina boyeri]